MDSNFFSWFPFLFMVVFVLIFGVIVFTLFRNLKQWNHNNHAPQLSVIAIVVAKRTYVGRHAGNDNTTVGYTRYYATFQVESGDRMELEIPVNQYGYLVEGDQGKLTFQGTRFISFARG